jgi:hypothetical protein
MSRHRLAQWVAATLLGFVAGDAKADHVSIAGTGTVGDFTGDLSYSGGIITLVLNNTSPMAHGGFITGVALNNPAVTHMNITGISASTAPNATFSLIGGPSFDDSIPVSPFGADDFGSAIGGDWLGGGNPTTGIPTGPAGTPGTGTFTWTVTGDISSLSAAAIANALNDDGNLLVVRFKGFDPDNSDKVPVDTINNIRTTPVPAPPALVLGFIGAAGLFGKRALARKRTPEMA